MNNQIEVALISARDAFNKNANHHRERWKHWQTVNDDPNQPNKVVSHWVQCEENMALANKMQDALNNIVLRKLNKAWEQDE